MTVSNQVYASISNINLQEDPQIFLNKTVNFAHTMGATHVQLSSLYSTARAKTAPPAGIKLALYSIDVNIMNLTNPVINILVDAAKTFTFPASTILIEQKLDPASNPGGVNGPIGFRGSYYVSIAAYWIRSSAGAAADGDQLHIGWARNISAALEPYVQSRYINSQMFENANDTRACYDAQSWARIERVKSFYDPFNLYRELDYYKTALGTQATDAALDAGVL